MATARPTTDESATQPAGNGRGTNSPFGDKAYKGSKKGHKKTPQALKDMRYVWDHEDESGDTTQGRKICRRMLKENPGSFLQRLQSMEKDHRSASAKSVAEAAKAEAKEPEGVAAEADEGTKAVLELIDRLLGDGGQEAKESRTRDGR